MNLLINFIINNFWMIILILALLSNDGFFIPGILLLLSLIRFGTIPIWLLAIIIFIGIFTSYLYPRKYYKNFYKKKYLKDIEDLYKDY